MPLEFPALDPSCISQSFGLSTPSVEKLIKRAKSRKATSSPSSPFPSLSLALSLCNAQSQTNRELFKLFKLNRWSLLFLALTFTTSPLVRSPL